MALKVKRMSEVASVNEGVYQEEITEKVSGSNPIKKEKEFEEEIKNDTYADALEIKEMPSHFLPYNVNSFYIRKLKVKEVKLLTKLNKEPSVELIVRAHKNAILNYRAEELIPVDLKALILLIATLTEPTFRLNLSYYCPNAKCKYHNETINNALSIEDISYEELEAKEFELQGRKFTPLRVKDLLFYDRFEKEIVERLEEEYDPDDQTMLVLALCRAPEIADTFFGDKSVDVEDAGKWAVDKFLEVYDNDIGEMDYSIEVEELAKKLFPDIEPYKAECPSCGEKFDVYLNLDFHRIYL